MVDAIILRLKSTPYINVFQETLSGGREEYEALKEFLRGVDREFFFLYPQVLLLFVGQFMRREVFKRGRLWKDLWPCINRTEDFQIRLYNRIEAAMFLMGIELIIEQNNGRRLFVETFWREVGLTPHNVREFLEIFWWYYDNYYPTKEFDEALFSEHRYYQDFAEQFYLISDAVDKLIAVVEFVQDSDLPFDDLDDANITVVRRKFHEHLGFDPLRILPSEEYIIQVYARSLNYITPSKFKQIVGRKNTGKVITPWGKAVPGHILIADDNLAYGEYVAFGRIYRVSPHPKINLGSIASWPLQKLMFPLPGFVGYRSRSIFPVLKNQEELEPAELYYLNRTLGYVWCGRIPVGGSLSVDNKEVPPLEGIQWQPTLKLRWPNAEKGIGPELEIEVGTVRVNIPELRGRKIEIKIGEIKFFAVVRMTGACRIDVPAVRLDPLNNGKIPVRIVFEDVVAERFIELTDIMLFSASTRGKISKKRKWIEDCRFYLFSKTAVEAGSVKGASIEAEYSYGQYYVYYIVRIDNELKIGEGDEYELFEPEFIQLNFQGNYTQSNRVIHKVDELSFQGLTNIVDERVVIGVNLFKEMDLLRTKEYNVLMNETKSSVYSFVIEDRTFFKDIPYGRYTVIVESDTVKSNPITFSFIPSPDALYGAEYTYAEGEQMVITAKWNDCLVDCVAQAWVEQRVSENKIICTPVTSEANFDLLREGIVDFPARYSYTFSPVVFGVRILYPVFSHGRQGDSILTHPERNDLKKAILYAFGRPKAQVVVSFGSASSRHELDEHGQVRIPLSFLIDKLTDHINILSVNCEGLERQVAIRWWPRIKRPPRIIRLHSSVCYEIEVFGPSGVMLEVKAVDIYGTVHQSSRHGLTGGTTIVTGIFRITPGMRYVILGSIIEGEFVPIHQQYRIPSKPLPSGTGIGVGTDHLTACVRDFFMG